MKRLAVILGLFLYCTNNYACQCWLEDGDRSWKRYTEIKHCFIGHVIKIEIKEHHRIFTFEIQKVYKGNFGKTVKIYSGSGGGDCGTYFSLNDTFLVCPDKDEGKYWASSCAINSRIHDYYYRLDTTFMNNYKKKNFYFNFPEFRGEIKNGLFQGVWKYYSYEVKSIDDTSAFPERIITYEKGKRIGSYGYMGKEIVGKSIYKNGKRLETIHYKLGTDSIEEINYSDGTTKSFYPNGKLRQTMHRKHNKGYILKYNQNEQVIKKVPFDKRGFVYGYIIDYNPDGTIKNKTFVEKNTTDEKWYYWD